MPIIRFELYDGNFLLTSPKMISHHDDNRLVVIETNRYSRIQVMPLGDVFVYDPRKVEVVGMYYLFFDFSPVVFPAIFARYIHGRNGLNEYVRFSVREHAGCPIPYISIYMKSRDHLLNRKLELTDFNVYMYEIRSIRQEIFRHIRDMERLDIKLALPLLPDKGKMLMWEKMNNAWSLPVAFQDFNKTNEINTGGRT